MANYAHVVDGTIEGVYDTIPNNWRNVSNFYVLTEEERLSFGWYTIVQAYPDYNPETQKLDNPSQYFTDGVAYETMEVIDLPVVIPTVVPVSEPTAEEIAIQEQQNIANAWAQARRMRDDNMKNFEWRYTRYERQVRLSITPIDNIEAMDAYMQSLADITTQTDPFNLIWPTYTE
jgi:hypothetical protein